MCHREVDQVLEGAHFCLSGNPNRHFPGGIKEEGAVIPVRQQLFQASQLVGCLPPNDNDSRGFLKGNPVDLSNEKH